MNRKVIIMLLSILLIFGAVAAGCSTEKKKTSADLLNARWDHIAAQAKGQKVNLHMWGGSDTINRYIDEWVAPRLKQAAGVELHRVPVNDTKDIINQLLDEKQAGKSSGSVDIVWMNGENFKAAKDNRLLWGSFASKLPMVQEYVDMKAPDIASDFGEPTNGLEAPWGKAQFVFAYDSAKIPNPPKSMEDLLAWVKKNPGKFTYPAPPDFTGSAFVRQTMYETTGGYEPYMKPLNDKAFEAKLSPLWAYLKNIKPYLWREGKTYPESLAKLNQLYTNGEVWMTMSYDPASASSAVNKGTFPKTTRTFVLDGGTLSNTHYLSIPFNAPHPAGAMATIDFLLSPDAQIAKNDPAHWGDMTSLDPKKLSEADRQRLLSLDLGVATLPASVLASHRLPEIPSKYVDVLEKAWTDDVAKK